MIFLLILLIPFLIPTRVQAVSGLFRMLMGLCSYMIMGGTTMIIELVKDLRYKNAQTTNKETSEVEKVLSDPNFFEILKNYAKKELSLENILLYERLEALKQCQHNSLHAWSIVDEIEADFMRSYCKYEVNLSSQTRKSFYEWFNKRQPVTPSSFSLSELPLKETMDTHPSNPSQLHDILLPELLQNILDTFSRLQSTQVYQNWEHTVHIQRSQSIARTRD